MIAVHFHLSLFLTGILLIRWEQSIKQKPSTEQAYDSFQDEHVHKQNLEQFSNFASRSEKNKHNSLLSFKYSHNYVTVQQTWDVNMYVFTQNQIHVYPQIKTYCLSYDFAYARVLVLLPPETKTPLEVDFRKKVPLVPSKFTQTQSQTTEDANPPVTTAKLLCQEGSQWGFNSYCDSCWGKL